MDLAGRTATGAAAAYHQQQHHHHHHPRQQQSHSQQQQHQQQFPYEQPSAGEVDHAEVISSVRGDQHSTLAAKTMHQKHGDEVDVSAAGGAGTKFKRICYGSTADTAHADSDNLANESAHSTFVIPLPMTTGGAMGTAHRPVIQFQHHQSPPRAGQSHSPSSSSSSSSSQNSRRDHNIDYSTLFVQLSGTFPTLYRCVNCHKTVSNRWHHANIHRPQSHACPICGQKFTRRDNMKAHCKIKHADMRTSPSGPGSAITLNTADQGYFTHFVQM